MTELIVYRYGPINGPKQDDVQTIQKHATLLLKFAFLSSYYL